MKFAVPPMCSAKLRKVVTVLVQADPLGTESFTLDATRVALSISGSDSFDVDQDKLRSISMCKTHFGVLVDDKQKTLHFQVVSDSMPQSLQVVNQAVLASLQDGPKKKDVKSMEAITNKRNVTL